MWFKQNEPKSPAPPAEAPLAKPSVQTVAPAVPVESPAPAAVMPLAPAGAPTARFSRGLMVKGEISGKEDLWIDGGLEGTLRLDGARLTIGPSGRVHGDVFAREIIVQGQVSGNLHADERIEVTPSGAVTGDAVTKRIAIEEGGVFNGSIEMPRHARAEAEAGAARQPDARTEPRSDRAAKAAAALSAVPLIEAAEIPGKGAAQQEHTEKWSSASLPGSESTN
jgi:cytoskeletal protein CcmA (bactofilin family)